MATRRREVAIRLQEVATRRQEVATRRHRLQEVPQVATRRQEVATRLQEVATRRRKTIIPKENHNSQGNFEGCVWFQIENNKVFKL